MIKFTTEIGIKEGLHARPASELVKLCQKAVSDIKLAKGDNEVDPKSILGILTLAAKHKDVITVTVDGKDEEAISASLKEYLENSSH